MTHPNEKHTDKLEMEPFAYIKKLEEYFTAGKKHVIPENLQYWLNVVVENSSSKYGRIIIEDAIEQLEGLSEGKTIDEVIKLGKHGSYYSFRSDLINTYHVRGKEFRDYLINNGWYTRERLT